MDEVQLAAWQRAVPWEGAVAGVKRESSLQPEGRAASPSGLCKGVIYLQSRLLSCSCMPSIGAPVGIALSAELCLTQPPAMHCRILRVEPCLPYWQMGCRLPCTAGCLKLTLELLVDAKPSSMGCALPLKQ